MEWSAGLSSTIELGWGGKGYFVKRFGGGGGGRNSVCDYSKVHVTNLTLLCLFPSKPADTIGCKMVFVGWKARVSTRLQVNKYHKFHYLALCGIPSDSGEKGKPGFSYRYMFSPGGGTAIFNPLSPGIKLQILLLCFHTFLKEVVGRRC